MYDKLLFAEARFENERKRFYHGLARHFGGAEPPVHECDRGLNNPKTLFLRSVGQLYLKSVASRFHRAHVETLQDSFAVTTEAARAIMYCDAKHKAGEDVSSSTTVSTESGLRSISPETAYRREAKEATLTLVAGECH